MLAREAAPTQARLATVAAGAEGASALAPADVAHLFDGMLPLLHAQVRFGRIFASETELPCLLAHQVYIESSGWRAVHIDNPAEPHAQAAFLRTLEARWAASCAAQAARAVLQHGGGSADAAGVRRATRSL
jgi:hypothetical protein